MAHRKELRIALTYLREGRKIHADYDAEVAAWYADPDQRYRFPHCIHGTSLWTDYDNICFGCEDGVRYDDPRMCLDRAKRDLAECEERVTLIGAILRKGVSASSDLGVALIDWALEPTPATPDRQPRPLP